jgi:hypothetical protein
VVVGVKMGWGLRRLLLWVLRRVLLLLLLISLLEEVVGWVAVEEGVEVEAVGDIGGVGRVG